MTSLHLRAERATLGAILHEPALLDELADRLGPDAWERPYHYQVWGAMMRLRAREEDATPKAVAAELATDPDIRDQAAASVQLAELMEAAPRTGHAAYYARMVGDSARRRTLMSVARRLAQAATWVELDDTVAQVKAARKALTPVREGHYGPPPRAVAPTSTEQERQARLDALLDHADRVRVRAETATGPERSSLAADLAAVVRQVCAAVMEMQWKPLPAHPDQQHVGARTLAARAAQAKQQRRRDAEEAATEGVAVPDRPGRSFEAGPLEPDAPTSAVASVERTREDAERQMLAAIAADPDTGLAAADTLTRDQWADTWRRDVATLAHGLHSAGEPVDALTLMWAARQAGIVADQPTGDQIPADELADALNGPHLDAGGHARDISHAATRITVAQAAEQVLAAADDPTQEVTITMDQLDTALARIAPDQQASREPDPPDVADPTTSAATDHAPATADQAERTPAQRDVQVPSQRSRIDPAAPVEQMAQDVVDRVTRHHGAGAVDRAQVERVLVEHCHVDQRKARRAATRAAQLDSEAVTGPRKVHSSEVHNSTSHEVRKSRTVEDRERHERREHEEAERRDAQRDDAQQRVEAEQTSARPPAAVGR